MDHADLVGHKLTFHYASETYEIDIRSADRLRWTRTEGEDIGKGDVEAYVYSRLSPDIALISWVEADGLGLSNALNFARGTVTTHANMAREVFENQGRLSVASLG